MLKKRSCHLSDSSRFVFLQNTTPQIAPKCLIHIEVDLLLPRKEENSAHSGMIHLMKNYFKLVRSSFTKSVIFGKNSNKQL